MYLFVILETLGYMTSPHPTSIHESKDVEFCFHWPGISPRGPKCQLSRKGKVTNCGGFYVYLLRPVSAHFRYCAEP